MPFDAISSRPFMRCATAELALMVDKPGADLRAILAELSHRDRKPAKRLAETIAGRLAPMPAAPEVPSVPFEVIPCLHGEVIPEARETVVEVIRVSEVPAAKPAKPAKAPKRDKRPGDVGWNPPSLNVVIKRAGNPSCMWSSDIAGAFGNPLKAARFEALKAEGWQHVADRDGYQILARGDARLRIGHHGMIYCGDATWVQLDKAERDRLTDAGRPILARLAALAAAQDKLAAARSRRAALVKHFPKHRSAAKGATWAAAALLGAKGEARATWRALVKARAEVAAARAA
jgi:hypothetical protein